MPSRPTNLVDAVTKTNGIHLKRAEVYKKASLSGLDVNRNLQIYLHAEEVFNDSISSRLAPRCRSLNTLQSSSRT
jgi:hypothetical protein